MRRFLTLFLPLVMIAAVSIALFYFSGQDLERAVKHLFTKESQENLNGQDTHSWVTPHEPQQDFTGKTESVYEESKEYRENKPAESDPEAAGAKREEADEQGTDQQNKNEDIATSDIAQVKTPPPVEKEEETKKEPTVVDKEAVSGEENKETVNEEPAKKEENTVKKETGSLSDKELQFLNLLNNARRSHNLPELAVSGQLTRAARAKSKDMADNNYFAHTSPVYGDLEGILRHFKIKYSYAGENLAMDSCGNIPGAHQGLMNSTDHRRNILDRNYTHIGVGIVERSDGYHYYTQLFVTE